MSNMNSDPKLRKRLTAASMVVLGAIGITACGLDKTGYSKNQKAQLQEAIQPEAVSITQKLLTAPDASVSISEDGKSFTVYSKDYASEKPHYEAIASIAKTGDKPDPNQVADIKLYRLVVDPTNHSQLAIDSSIEIRRDGDQTNTDPYWFVDSFHTLGDADKNNDINLTDLPINNTTNAEDMGHILDAAKVIVDEVRTIYEPGLFPKK
jgi:hypothetical protein